MRLCIDEFKHQDDLSILDLGWEKDIILRFKNILKNSDIYGLDISRLLLIWQHVIVKMLLGL